jgi:hypothetical protein
MSLKDYIKLKTTKLLIFTLIIFLVAQGTGFAQDKAAKIDELMKLYNDYGQFNGSVLVAENGKVIYKKGLGVANMEWNTPNTYGYQIPDCVSHETVYRGSHSPTGRAEENKA